MAADNLSQLLETTWRGIPVPTMTVSTSSSHNLVGHKRVDRNGWRVENTGQNANVYTFRIPFLNTIARGRNETWDNLYPDTYRRFIPALEDRATGDLQHPDYGLRRCKVDKWDTSLDPDFRGGPVITASFIETADEGDAVSLANNSAFGLGRSSAISLDSTLRTLTPPPDTGLEADGFASFEDFMRKLSTVGDQVDLMRAQAVAKIDRMIAKVDGLEATYGRTITGFSDTAGRFISACLDIKTNLTTKDREKAFYVVPKVATLASIAQRLKSSTSEMVSLNPHLAGGLKVPPETLVRYYVR